MMILRSVPAAALVLLVMLSAASAQAPDVSIGVQIATDADSGKTVVKGLAENGPAAKAGVKEGDFILKVGDKAVASHQETADEVFKHKVGDKLKLTLRTGDKERTVEVTVARRSDVYPGN